MLSKQDIQSVKHTVRMINAHAGQDEIGKYLDGQDNVSEALATHYAVYTSHIYHDRTDALIDSDVHNDEGLDFPYKALAEDSAKINSICEDYDYPIVQGNPQDVANPTGCLMDSDYRGEISMPALKRDLLSLVKRCAPAEE